MTSTAEDVFAGRVQLPEELNFTVTGFKTFPATAPVVAST
jgi:hypothetical protein